MKPTEQKLIERLLTDERLTDRRWVAYIMATVKHETNETFEPVEEAYWLSDAWRYANLRYAPWWGRGFVQITWKTNYEKMSHRLSIPWLATTPDAALDLDVAYEILVVGMLEGLFTGKDIDDYINEDYCDYYRARKIVNGMDKAKLIAGYAEEYENVIASLQNKDRTTSRIAEAIPTHLITDNTIARPPYPKHLCQYRVIYQQSEPQYDPCVERAQRALNEWHAILFFNKIQVDGKFGPKTYHAVCEFQRTKRHKLIDGIIGQRTWADLEKYL